MKKAVKRTMRLPLFLCKNEIFCKKIKNSLYIFRLYLEKSKKISYNYII